MPITKSACPLDCPDACGMLVETDQEGRFTKLRGNPAHPWSKGSLCGKTANMGDLILGKERLLHPLLRNARGGFDQVSWDRALGIVAHKLGELPGADMLALPYGGNMGQVARKFPMRIFHALGAAETDGGICDAGAEAGVRAVLGDVIGADLTSAVEDADVIVIWGCDARRTMQHLMPRVKRAIKGGAKVWVVDIWRTDTVRLVEQWGGRGVILKPGSDALLALGLCALAFDERAADLAYLKDACAGGAEFRAEVAGRYGMDEVCAGTGLDKDLVLAMASDFHGSSKPLFKVGIGIGRRRNGAMSVRSVCSYAAVLGQAERVHWESADHFDLDREYLAGEQFRPEGEQRPKDVVHVALGRELMDGRFHAAAVWGHNPAVTVPDSNRVRAGLARDDLFLVVHELVMTETAKLADVILPAASLVEQTDLLLSYGQRVLQVTRAACMPRGEARSNLQTFAALGKRLELDAEVWDHTEEGMVQAILDQNRARFTNMEWTSIHADEPTQLAPSPRQATAKRATPSGRVQLVDPALAELGQPIRAEYVPDDGAGLSGAFWLVAAPSKATHNSTYAHSERHVARAGKACVRVCAEDAEQLGFADGEVVRVHNVYGALSMPVSLCEQMPKGLVRIDGFPNEADIPQGIGINALGSPETSDLGSGSVQYSVRVDIGPEL
ncbi:MAG: anaerobic selenocysteine-containing dehydrogenase [Planctomycetota bacterium]|jgi:anaerobic selenocysteine-containing dehydrogenase